jgi:hypothetical protein
MPMHRAILFAIENRGLNPKKIHVNLDKNGDLCEVKEQTKEIFVKTPTPTPKTNLTSQKVSIVEEVVVDKHEIKESIKQEISNDFTMNKRGRKKIEILNT